MVVLADFGPNLVHFRLLRPKIIFALIRQLIILILRGESFSSSDNTYHLNAIFLAISSKYWDFRRFFSPIRSNFVNLGPKLLSRSSVCIQFYCVGLNCSLYLTNKSAKIDIFSVILKKWVFWRIFGQMWSIFVYLGPKLFSRSLVSKKF